MGTVPSDAILVLNAGSSSIKLAVFAVRGGDLALELYAYQHGVDKPEVEQWTWP
jgi:acetate kinase